jgi:uncharacterized membrane protein YebE (DUF533 family)
MANLTEIIGALIQSGPAKSTNSRLQNALGAGGPADGNLLDSLFGGSGASGSGAAAAALVTPCPACSGAAREVAGSAACCRKSWGRPAKAVGGNQNLALGGLGALAGALLGGGSSSLTGAAGGGVMALLGAMAYQALKGTQQETQEVPLGLREPTSPAEAQQLDSQAGLILKAMINAAKADGQIDRAEVQRIIGRLEAAGIDRQARDFVLSEMNKPMDTEAMIAAARGNPQLAAQLYAASLLAIEVDTPAEHAYMENLARGPGLGTQAVAKLENVMGIR